MLCSSWSCRANTGSSSSPRIRTGATAYTGRGKKCIIYTHRVSSTLVSGLMRFSDMMPSPPGDEELEIPRPPCVKLLPPRRARLPGGPADTDKLTMAECSTSHF
ncbi:unnamed protein product [Pleuronectes platessa]|uniref:Uncharacterized protein n=1 Tax=Pleuronectes platessa TaxID=8262 RepID=A0A9N7VJK1_PLEPL|nr:unnamed protein product [Pleuronectes platessa]